jgi:hypothetical protein
MGMGMGDNSARWRCVGCKGVFSGPIEPEWCGSCQGRTFVEIDRPTPQPDSDLVEKVARVLYDCERKRSEHADTVLSKVAGKPVKFTMEPWEEAAEIYRGDARAALAALSLPRTYGDGIEDAARVAEPVNSDANPGDITWHCSEDDGGPDVGVSLQIAPGIELWCGEISNHTHAEANPDVRAIDESAGGSWLVLYGPDGTEIIGQVGDFEGRRLLEEVLAPAIRTLSPSGIEDVREALTKAGEEGFFDRVRECVKEYAEDGFWNTCSGCHESEDGYDVGHYPFSESFNCKLGGGCSECGGIGAIWDTTDYDAMAREMLACDATESASSKIGGGNG